MKKLYSCDKHHNFLSDEQDLFRKPHPGCGGRVVGSKPVIDESELITCHICGSPELPTYERKTREALIQHKLCFECLFWQQYFALREANDPRAAVIEGNHYLIQPDYRDKDEARRFGGFGGDLFVIEFLDGRVVTTRNLWHQGDIPERFRSLLPDNAKFVNETKNQNQSCVQQAKGVAA